MNVKIATLTVVVIDDVHGDDEPDDEEDQTDDDDTAGDQQRCLVDPASFLRFLPHFVVVVEHFQSNNYRLQRNVSSVGESFEY